MQYKKTNKKNPIDDYVFICYIFLYKVKELMFETSVTFPVSSKLYRDNSNFYQHINSSAIEDHECVSDIRGCDIESLMPMLQGTACSWKALHPHSWNILITACKYFEREYYHWLWHLILVAANMPKAVSTCDFSLEREISCFILKDSKIYFFI